MVPVDLTCLTGDERVYCSPDHPPPTRSVSTPIFLAHSMVEGQSRYSPARSSTPSIGLSRTGSIQLTFESDVSAPPPKVWKRITSLKGISSDMRLFFLMTAPGGVADIEDLKIAPGRPLFRSRFFLFGFIPADLSDITLIEFEKGSGAGGEL